MIDFGLLRPDFAGEGLRFGVTDLLESWPLPWDFVFRPWFVCKNTFEFASLNEDCLQLLGNLCDLNCFLQDQQFWSACKLIDPELFVVFNFYFQLVAKEQELIEQIVSNDLFKSLEDREIEHALKEREQFFKTQGPDCGPEICVEEGCENLRIKLATRCTKHQYEWCSIPCKAADES